MSTEARIAEISEWLSKIPDTAEGHANWQAYYGFDGPEDIRFLLDELSALRERAEAAERARDEERRAAGHWMSEANREHNHNRRLAALLDEKLAELLILRKMLEKWRSRGERGFDPDERPETAAFWAGAKRVVDELESLL